MDLAVLQAFELALETTLSLGAIYVFEGGCILEDWGPLWIEVERPVVFGNRVVGKRARFLIALENIDGRGADITACCLVYTEALAKLKMPWIEDSG